MKRGLSSANDTAWWPWIPVALMVVTAGLPTAFGAERMVICEEFTRTT